MRIKFTLDYYCILIIITYNDNISHGLHFTKGNKLNAEATFKI